MGEEEEDPSEEKAWLTVESEMTMGDEAVWMRRMNLPGFNTLYLSIYLFIFT